MHDDDLIEAWRLLAAQSRRRRDAEAEDHVQDAILAALDVRSRTGRSPEAPRAWLGTVARRREVDRIRRAVCERRAVVASADVTEDVDTTGEVLDRYEARWLAAHVDRLPATTRDVVHELASGATQGEIAGRLGLTPRAVEAHVRRARLALRRVLDRAGSVVVLLRASRWLRRRAVPIAVAGLGAAVAASLMWPADTHQLMPLPPSPIAMPTPRVPPAGPGPGVATTGHGDAAYAMAVPYVVPRTYATAAPVPAAPPSSTAAPDPVGTQMVLVPATGGEQPTEFPTEAGAWYEITAAGIYSYNGRVTGAADCGHYVKEGDSDWTLYDALIVDGHPSPCGRMPLDAAHVYRWRQRGTGRPMTFRIHDDGGNADNLGSLAVSVMRVSGPLS